MSESEPSAAGWGERTSNDVAGLAIELSRLVKALCFFGNDHEDSQSLMQRGYLVWQLELERAGSIEIARDGDVLSEATTGKFNTDAARDLVEAMQRHRIERVQFDSEVALESFCKFASLLSLEGSEGDEQVEDFAGQLYATSALGIEINGEHRPLPDAPQSASLGSLLLGDGPRVPLVDLTTYKPVPDSPQASRLPEEVPPVESNSASASDWPTIEEDPLDAPSTGMAGERLKISLRELDRCTDEGVYAALLDRIKETTRALFEAGHRDEIYRTLLVLSDHAAGQHGCSGAQVVLAQSALERLARPICIRHVIDLACRAGSRGIRPAQVFLQLGELSALPLLDALNDESDGERVALLAGMILALGEQAVPALGEMIRLQRGGRIQLAVRLAGELQSPKLVPALRCVLLDSGPALRREAGRALVSIGNEECFKFLVETLDHPGDELPSIAAICLSEFQGERAVQPLIRTLRRAGRERLPRLAEASIRALAKLGSQHIAIIDALAAVLEERVLFRKRRQRRVKIAALEVLGGFESRAANRLIVEATRDSDTSVSDRAREILAEPERYAAKS